jgi:hypothetical protein
VFLRFLFLPVLILLLTRIDAYATSCGGPRKPEKTGTAYLHEDYDRYGFVGIVETTLLKETSFVGTRQATIMLKVRESIKGKPPQNIRYEYSTLSGSSNPFAAGKTYLVALSQSAINTGTTKSGPCSHPFHLAIEKAQKELAFFRALAKKSEVKTAH